MGQIWFRITAQQYHKDCDVDQMMKTRLMLFGLDGNDIARLYHFFLEILDCNIKQTSVKYTSVESLIAYYEADETPFVRRLFQSFDHNQNGQIAFEEFAKALWTYCPLSGEDFPLFTFDLYDFDGKGKLSSASVELLFKDLYGKDFHNRKNLQESLENLLLHTDEKDVQGNGIVSSDEFKFFVRSHNSMLFPAFRIQSQLRKRTGGEYYWNTVRQRHKGEYDRIKLLQGRFQNAQIRKQSETRNRPAPNIRDEDNSNELEEKRNQRRSSTADNELSPCRRAQTKLVNNKHCAGLVEDEQSNLKSSNNISIISSAHANAQNRKFSGCAASKVVPVDGLSSNQSSPRTIHDKGMESSKARPRNPSLTAGLSKHPGHNASAPSLKDSRAGVRRNSTFKKDLTRNRLNIDDDGDDDLQVEGAGSHIAKDTTSARRSSLKGAQGGARRNSLLQKDLTRNRLNIEEVDEGDDDLQVKGGDRRVSGVEIKRARRSSQLTQVEEISEGQLTGAHRAPLKKQPEPSARRQSRVPTEITAESRRSSITSIHNRS